MDMSPDYILEKYNHWIGFTPTVEYESYFKRNEIKNISINQNF